MTNITSLSIDLAKNVFQLHGTNSSGKTIFKKRISRNKLAEVVANIIINLLIKNISKT